MEGKYESLMVRLRVPANEFLDALSELVKHGFRLKEEVYLEAVRKAREIAKETY